MTTLEAIHFAARIQIGTEIRGYGNSILVVTEIKKNSFKGYSKYAFEKFGKKTDTRLFFDTLLNPHYNKNLAILD